MPVLIHPAAFEELKEAIHFYDSKVEGLGKLFLDEIERGIEIIQNAPKTWRKYSKNYRRFLLTKYPFAIIYRLKNNSIQIIAFMHLHRKPNYWKSRLN
ncbi:MAG: type II toxin-antitoxin system RelE/ParE family toxin [Ignavibacteriales bacterium]|nr:type II toxin-antitoxin system RelE/ParE family toxin [Ignavibacteriales bacterium]